MISVFFSPQRFRPCRRLPPLRARKTHYHGRPEKPVRPKKVQNEAHQCHALFSATKKSRPYNKAGTWSRAWIFTILPPWNCFVNLKRVKTIGTHLIACGMIIGAFDSKNLDREIKKRDAVLANFGMPQSYFLFFRQRKVGKRAWAGLWLTFRPQTKTSGYLESKRAPRGE